MKDNTFTFGSVVAAFLASLCCLGPLLGGGLGLGTVLVATYAPLRPYSWPSAGRCSAWAFISCIGNRSQLRLARAKHAHRAGPKTGGEDDALGGCRWSSGPGTLPFVRRQTGRGQRASRQATLARLDSSELKITGMDCAVCASVIQRKLLETPGVVKASVEYPAGHATVEFDPALISPEKLVEVVNSTGYKASLLRRAGASGEARVEPTGDFR